MIPMRWPFPHNLNMSSDDPVLLGVDGGATGIRCYEVCRLQERGAAGYRIGAASAESHYPHVPGFIPVAPERQRDELEQGNLAIDSNENDQAQAWIDTAASVIRQVASAMRATSVVVGIGMPGLKSGDRRGVLMVNNGPRMPDFLSRLSDRLNAGGVRLHQPIRRIGDDGVYCGLGEEHAEGGLFREVENAYYIGGGTGLAECLKIDGGIRPLGGSEGTPRAWEMPSPLGPSYEKLISAASMNAIYRGLNATGGDKQRSYPESDAADGNPIATSWMHCVATLFAHLIMRRLEYLQDSAFSARPLTLDRIVLGQRLGRIFATPRFRPIFAAHVESILSYMIRGSSTQSSSQALSRYLDGGGLRDGFLMASSLRAAPAIGAAVDAVEGDRATFTF